MTTINPTPSFILDIINQNWVPGKKILDIGCGPAILRKEFKEDYIGLDYTDADFYPGVHRDVDLICSADNIKMADESVDIAIMKSMLYLLPDIDKSLSEAYRVLNKGGKLLVFDYNYKTQKQLEYKCQINYPCWTQWGLRSRLLQAGFTSCEIIVPKSPTRPQTVNSTIRVLANEIKGSWAIVTGTKT